MAQQVAQYDPTWGYQINRHEDIAPTAIWCVNITRADRVPNQIIATRYMCVDRNQELWFVLVLRRHNLHPEQYLPYVYIPPFAPWALQNYLCNVRSWSSQREYVRRSNHLQINIWDPRLFGDLVFDEDEYPNVSRLVLEITLLPGDQIPPNVNLWPDYCVRYPAAMLAQNNFIPEPQPAMIPAAPGQVDGAAPPPAQHIPELTNNNILTLSNLSVPAQNPALAQAAHNPQAVRAALTYIDPLQVETRRSQRLATRNGGSYELFSKLP